MAVPELLQTCNLQSTICNLHLLGHETLGQWDGATWAYYLPDALGSIRQTVNAAGAVVDTREWTPYGVEVGVAQGGPGYTGEWWDAGVGLVYLRARWLDVATGRFTQRDPWAGDIRRPRLCNGWSYASGNPINYSDPTGRVPTPNHSYSCRCGWIDWGHAGPGTARTIKERIQTDITDGSPDYFAIHTGLASVLPPVEGTAVVRKGLSDQEQKEVALGIFMSLEIHVEDAQLEIEQLSAGRITHSGYSLEDLPSDLISFYVAWETEYPFVTDDRQTAVEKLKAYVGPICHVLDDKDSMDVLAAFERTGMLYLKNFNWYPLVMISPPNTGGHHPRIPSLISPGCSAVSQVITEKCCGVDTSWPRRFSGVAPEPSRVNGKWWWWRGPWTDAPIAPSDEAGVYLYDVAPPSTWTLP